MSVYKYGRYETWEGFDYFAISVKTFWGWKKEKIWNLGYEFFNEFTKEDVISQRKLMMESVDRLVKAGHTVI